MTDHAIGIDISKSRLDAFRLEDSAAKQFGNTSRGFRALIRWLGKAPVARIVFEPTGTYHRAFETALPGKFPQRPRVRQPNRDFGGPHPSAHKENKIASVNEV
ncbi:IS110 family transposase [Mangrovicoccus ximenensis]|uniref:IS110 family transposase n=1 Tax=Mangrovicoccus ximenensis TaxID=1911570 RepID=UPI001374D424|nr:IS110 family transposase [Mangrovicoccus ximenensis]